MRLTHLSLFSGIGGLDLAAEWKGRSEVYRASGEFKEIYDFKETS